MAVQDPILRSFDALVSRHPSAPLVVSAGRRVTAADVDALARAAARHLPREAGGMIGLLAPNGPGFLASLVALRRNGSAAVLLDAQSPTAEVRRTLGALGVRSILRCRTSWPAGPEDWERGLATDGTTMDAGLPPGTAVVKVTSGSTGEARGVAASSEALLSDAAGLASSMGLRDGDPILATVPMSHAYGLSVLTIPALVRGALLITAEAETAPPPRSAPRCSPPFPLTSTLSCGSRSLRRGRRHWAWPSSRDPR
jgi:acyl-CoA synthetase (AMP-forming)/AMP-acid ligase II